MTLADRSLQAATDSGAVVRVEPKKSRSDARDMADWITTFNRQRFSGTRPRHADCHPCDGKWCDETCKLW